MLLLDSQLSTTCYLHFFAIFRCWRTVGLFLRSNRKSSFSSPTSICTTTSLAFRDSLRLQSTFRCRWPPAKGAWVGYCSHAVTFSIPESLLELTIHADGRLTHTDPSWTLWGHILTMIDGKAHILFGCFGSFRNLKVPKKVDSAILHLKTLHFEQNKMFDFIQENLVLWNWEKIPFTCTRRSSLHLEKNQQRWKWQGDQRRVFWTSLPGTENRNFEAFLFLLFTSSRGTRSNWINNLNLYLRMFSLMGDDRMSSVSINNAVWVHVLVGLHHMVPSACIHSLSSNHQLYSIGWGSST